MLVTVSLLLNITPATAGAEQTLRGALVDPEFRDDVLNAAASAVAESLATHYPGAFTVERLPVSAQLE